MLDNQTVARGATTLLNLSYDYAGANGKRTGQLTKILNNLNHNKDRGYSYDALGRLVQATGGPSASPLSTQTYSYDRNGNRLSVSASGYSAKNGSAGAGSAGGSSALSAQRDRGSSPTVREGSVVAQRGSTGTEPGALATGSFNQPSDPRVVLPTDLLAKNNTVELLASARDDSKPLSDSPSTLRAPSAPQTGPPTFTDDPLKDPQNPESFKIKALHLTELRTAINLLRARLGLAGYSWQQPTATNGVIAVGGLVTAAPIVEMRIALDEALGAPAGGYSAGLAQYQPILAIHIQELRDRIKSAWDAAGSSCPAGQTLLIDQFVKNFYQGALARQPNANELQSWSSQLRQAYYQGQTQLRVQETIAALRLRESQNPAFDPKKPECLPVDVKNSLQDISTKTTQADARQAPQEFGFAIERNGSSISPTNIIAGQTNTHGVNVPIFGRTLIAVHSHGALDEVGASTGPRGDVSEVQRMQGLGKVLPIYVVSRAGIVLYDISDKSTQGRTPGGTPGHESRGIIVGQLSGKNSIFKKPCL